ncbi:MAG: DUF2064 domain-containing protein [candidate division Zixibacteria bacterium]|nr:DUF2064 domain-containing protein [candidate division Zixibacteria bacterium]
MNSECIVIIANDPEKSKDLKAVESVIGKKKTGYLGRAMIFDTLAVCLCIPKVDIAIYYHPVPSKERFEKMISLFAREEKDKSIRSRINKIELYPQKAERPVLNISNAFEEVFNRGYKRVIMMGAYCMPLNKSIIKAGFILLESNNVIIGPSFSGRYYIFGMSQYIPEVFDGVCWENDDFYIRLGNNLKAAKAKVQELEISYEIYTPDELNQLIADIECWRSVGDNRTAYHTERFLRTLE